MMDSAENKTITLGGTPPGGKFPGSSDRLYGPVDTAGPTDSGKTNSAFCHVLVTKYITLSADADDYEESWAQCWYARGFRFVIRILRRVHDVGWHNRRPASHEEFLFSPSWFIDEESVVIGGMDFADVASPVDITTGGKVHMKEEVMDHLGHHITEPEAPHAFTNKSWRRGR